MDEVQRDLVVPERREKKKGTDLPRVAPRGWRCLPSGCHASLGEGTRGRPWLQVSHISCLFLLPYLKNGFFPSVGVTDVHTAGAEWVSFWWTKRLHANFIFFDAPRRQWPSLGKWERGGGLSYLFKLANFVNFVKLVSGTSWRFGSEVGVNWFPP